MFVQILNALSVLKMPITSIPIPPALDASAMTSFIDLTAFVSLVQQVVLAAQMP